VPTLTRPDGAEIHWEERGEGPAVVVTSAWSSHPGVFADMIDDLAGDHRVITFDARGTGRSTRSGPYDTETDTADLEALLEAVGGGVLWLVADTQVRGVRVLAARPALVPAAVSYGPPLSRTVLAGSEAMIASNEVVGAFQEMLQRDYRGALRSLVRAANEQMSEDEVRERVDHQADYCPQDAAVARVLAWAEDDPLEYARAAGDRLWNLITPESPGPWLPKAQETLRIVREVLPEARLAEVEDGALSRPDLSAEVVRRAVRETAGAAAQRK
jgi:pimeloyl-ACP methyl ester carboxylesterase